MADPDPGALVSRGRIEGSGFRVKPPVKLSQGPVGAYVGAGSGTSVEFHEFRDYQPGDDLRRVDWSVYARSDSLVVRLYHIEVSPVVEVLLDASASMGLHQGKAAVATFVAAFLAGAARKSEGRPVLVLEDGRVLADRFEQALASVGYSGRSDPLVASRWPRGSGRPLRYLVSDMLFPAVMDRYVSDLCRDATGLALVQILATSELAPRLAGGLRLVDAESPEARRDLRIDRAAIRRYGERLAAHLGAIEGAAARSRAGLVRIEVPDEVGSVDEVRDLVVPVLVGRGVVESA
jgi:uncharacterized protein (DUF58 family)